MGRCVDGKIVYLLIYSFTHLLIYSFTHLLIYSFTHLLIYSFTHLTGEIAGLGVKKGNSYRFLSQKAENTTSTTAVTLWF
ncbi:MAG: hypothetical protein JW804_07645 [Sedimentisphaerales bacterium]|nr:hypothetical protein [Sedimentisphaerales bacterium]